MPIQNGYNGCLESNNRGCNRVISLIGLQIITSKTCYIDEVVRSGCDILIGLRLRLLSFSSLFGKMKTLTTDASNR